VLVAASAFGVDGSGSITGTWTQENSPYHVLGNTNVPSGGMLVIEEGVEVNFFGYFLFAIDSNATLKVKGSAAEPVRFTSLFPGNG
jgi:hypothetical protein